MLYQLSFMRDSLRNCLLLSIAMVIVKSIADCISYYLVWNIFSEILLTKLLSMLPARFSVRVFPFRISQLLFKARFFLSISYSYFIKYSLRQELPLSIKWFFQYFLKVIFFSISFSLSIIYSYRMTYLLMIQCLLLSTIYYCWLW